MRFQGTSQGKGSVWTDKGVSGYLSREDVGVVKADSESCVPEKRDAQSVSILLRCAASAKTLMWLEKSVGSSVRPFLGFEEGEWNDGVDRTEYVRLVWVALREELALLSNRGGRGGVHNRWSWS